MAVGSGTPLSILFQILGIDEAKSKLATISPEMAKIQQAAKGATTDANAVSTSLQKVGSSSTGVNQASTNIQKLDTTTKTASTSTTKLATDQSKLDTSVKQSGTSASTASTSIDKLDKTQQTASSSATKLSTEHEKVKTSSSGVATSSGTVAGAMDKQSVAMDKGSESTGKVNTAHSTLRSSFVATAGSTTALVSSTVSLWESYDSLGDAQLRVDKASNALQTTRIKEQSLQIQLNKLVADGKTGTEQYALIQDKLTTAHEKVTAAEGTLQNSQEDLNIVQIDFYKEIVPKVITVLGSATSVIGSMSPLLGKFKEGLSNLSIESIKTSNAFKLISLTNPFFIALTVGGAILTAFVTNMFGFRDAINGIGVALGNAVQPIKPFLKIVGDLGQGLVNALGQGGKQAQAFGEEVDAGFKKGGAGAETGSGQVKSSLQKANDAIASTNRVVAGFVDDSGKNWSAAGDAPQALTTGLQGTLSDSDKVLAQMISDTEKAIAAIQATFNKTIKVGNLDVSGFNAAMNTSVVTVQTFEHRLSTLSQKTQESITSLSGYSKAAQFMNQVHVILNDSTGKTIVNQDELQTAFKKSGITIGEQKKIMDTMVQVLGVQFVSATNKNVSSLGALQQKHASLTEQYTAQIKKEHEGIGVSNEHSSVNDKLKGTTAGVTGALGQQANALDDNNQTMAESNDLLTSFADTASKTSKSVNENSAALNTAKGIQVLYGVALTESTKKIQDLQIETLKSIKATSDMTAFLNSAKGQAVSYAQGLVSMQEELNKTTASIDQNKGSLDQLTAQLITGKPEQDAFNAGLEAERLALAKVTLETDTNIGKALALTEAWNTGQLTIDAYNKGLSEQNIKMFTDAQAAFNLLGTVAKMHEQYNTGIPTVIAWTQGVAEQEKTLEDMILATDKATASNAVFTQSLIDHTRQSAEYNKGIQDQITTLNSLIASTANAQGVNKQYADQLNDTTLTLAKFAEGQTAAEKSMLEMVANTSKTAGEVSQLTANLKTGEEQFAQYSDGAVDASKKEIQMISETSNLKGEISSLAIAVKGVNAGMIEYNLGIEKGRVTALEHAKAVNEERGAIVGTRTVLFDLAKGYETAAEAARSSNEGLQQFNDVMRQSPSAIQKVIDGLSKFAESAGSKIAEAMGKGKGAVKEAIKSIQEELGRALSKPEIRTLQIEANTQKAVKTIQDDLSLAFAGAGQKAADSVGASINAAMKIAQQQIASSGGEIRGAWQSVLTSLQAIKTEPFNKQVWIESVAKITQQLDTLGISGQNAIKFLNDMHVPADVMAGVMQKLGTGVQTAGTAAAEADPQFQAMTDSITNLSFVSGLIQNVFETGIPQAIAGAAPALSAAANTYMQSGFSTITQVLLLLGPATTTAVQQVNTAFAALNPLQPLFTTGMATMAQALTLIGPGVTQAVNTANIAFGTLAPVQTGFQTGLIQIETALNLLGTETSLAVATANAAFATLNPSQAQFQTGLTQIETALNLLGTETTQAVAQANAAFTTLNPVSPTFSSGMQTIEQALNLLGSETQTAVGLANTAFDQLGVNLPTVYTKISTDYLNTINGIVNITKSIIPVSIPPLFTQMVVSVAGTYARMTTDSANAFNAIVNTAKPIINSIPPLFTAASTAIVNALNQLPTKVSQVFTAISTSAIQAANQVKTQLPAAFNTVVSAASSMASKVSSSFGQIVSSADKATKAVRAVQSAIDALKNKTVTITVVHRDVYQTVYGASGFGPAIVDHPVNMTVGESGPEYVSVVPLKSGANRTSSPGERLAMHADPGNIGSNNIRAADGFYIDDEGGVYGGSSSQRTHKSYSQKHRKRFGPNPRFIQDSFDDSTTGAGGGGGGMGNISYQNAEAYPGGGPAIQNTISLGNKIYSRLDSFTAGVSQFLGKASGVLTQATRTNTTGILSPGGGTTYADYGTTTPFTGHGNFIKLPDIGGGGTRSRSNISLPSSTGGNRDISTSFISQAGDMIGKIALRVLDTAANRMTLSINNQNIIDGKKIYESQQTHFGLKNGTLLK